MCIRDSRKALQDEVSALKDEINRIADSTNFNGINLLDGSMGVGTTGAEASVAADTTAKTSAFEWSISGGEGIKVTIATAAKSAAPKGVTASWGNDGNLTLTIDAANGTVIKQSDIDKALAAATGAPDNAKDLKVTLKSDITLTANSEAQADISHLTSAKAVQATHIDANGIKVSSTKAGVNTHTLTSVSYTHLDVYKRQAL